jgi:PHD/YefM family antitoxin component YafN of YafNO toxin-antitoxin module
MDIATTVYEQVKTMPQAKAYQVLDFVQWLESKPSSAETITLSTQEWANLQETLYVLQNPSLMEQLANSLETYQQGTGYQPTLEELEEGN